MKSPNYVIHATLSQADAERIRAEGFWVESGRAVVSTDLIFACELGSDPDKRVWSRSRTPIREGEPGRILVFQVPPDSTIDYAAKASITGITIESESKHISGYVSRYRYSRRQLSIYQRGLQTAYVHIPSQYVVMDLVCTEPICSVLFDLRTKTQKLERIDRISYTSRICKAIVDDPRNYVNHSLEADCDTLVRKLIDLTLESTWVNLVRSFSVDVRLAQGYTIRDLDCGQLMSADSDSRFLRARLLKHKLALDENAALDQERAGIDVYLRRYIMQLLCDLEKCRDTYGRNSLQQLAGFAQEVLGKITRCIRCRA